MIQSEASTEGENNFLYSYFTAPEQDEIFEESIDDFDDQMQNEYDDGIVQSDVDHLEDESEEDDHGDDEDNITPITYNDELEDYDELEG